MNYEKSLSLYRNDKTLQLLRAEHFPLLIAFIHLAFKQQDKISYTQGELQSLLSDFVYSLERQGITDYNQSSVDYLQRWAQYGYLRESISEAKEDISEKRGNIKWRFNKFLPVSVRKVKGKISVLKVRGGDKFHFSAKKCTEKISDKYFV